MLQDTNHAWGIRQAKADECVLAMTVYCFNGAMGLEILFSEALCLIVNPLALPKGQ